MPNTWGFAFAAFLVAHGLVTIIMYLAPSRPDAPFVATRSWLLSRAGLPEGVLRTLSRVLAAVATVAFVLAGLGVLGVPGLLGIWQWATVAGAAASLLLLGLFFQPWLTVGVLINVGLLLAVLVFHWPANEALGI